ncbi:MAG: TIGR03747 family integrating conjugative element membrane protein, partial [Gammaproteobacteria bacterium]
MSDPARPAERQQAQQQGLIAGLITLPIRLFGVLCGSLLLSVVIECLCMHFFWPQERWHHAERMLEFELDQLSVYFTQSLLVREPAQSAQRLVHWTYQHVFVNTRMLDWAHEASARNHTGASSAAGLRRLLGLAYVNVEAYVVAAGYTLLTFLVRLVVLCLTLPLFCLREPWVLRLAAR